MTSIPDTGSSAVCPYCNVKARNQHSISQSGECDGIRNNKIVGTQALTIRLRNGGKGGNRRTAQQKE